jgi:hypothetical protein
MPDFALLNLTYAYFACAPVSMLNYLDEIFCNPGYPVVL